MLSILSFDIIVYEEKAGGGRGDGKTGNGKVA